MPEGTSRSCLTKGRRKMLCEGAQRQKGFAGEEREIPARLEAGQQGVQVTRLDGRVGSGELQRLGYPREPDIEVGQDRAQLLIRCSAQSHPVEGAHCSFFRQSKLIAIGQRKVRTSALQQHGELELLD